MIAFPAIWVFVIFRQVTMTQLLFMMVQRARRSFAAAAGAVNKPWPHKVSSIRARRFIRFVLFSAYRPQTYTPPCTCDTHLKYDITTSIIGITETVNNLVMLVSCEILVVKITVLSHLYWSSRGWRWKWRTQARVAARDGRGRAACEARRGGRNAHHRARAALGDCNVASAQRVATMWYGYSAGLCSNQLSSIVNVNTVLFRHCRQCAFSVLVLRLVVLLW